MVWLPLSSLDPDQIRMMKRALTIHPRKFRNYGDGAAKGPVDTWIMTETEFGVPRAYFFDTAKQEHDITWEATHGVPMGGVENLLRQEGKYAEQGDAIAAINAHYAPAYSSDDQKSVGSAMAGILKGVTGFGKTNTGLAVAHMLGRRTGIVVHKEFLMRQWVHRIKKFLPGAKVGIVRESRCDFEGCDFVIAMAQSLALEVKNGGRYPKEFYESVGFLMVDEVHRLGAATWAPIPALFPAFHRLGLTATPRRKDGCDKVFWWNLGHVVYAAKTETPKPAVRMIASRSGKNVPVLQKENISPSITTNVLIKLTNRNNTIIDEVVGALSSPHERKVMVLSERLDHLRNLDELLGKRLGDNAVTTGFYAGQWFTGRETFSLKGRKKLGDDHARAVETIYRHFRRKKSEDKELIERLDSEDAGFKGKPKPTEVWGARCGRMIEMLHQDENGNDVYSQGHEVILYKLGTGERSRILNKLSDKQLCQLAQDYGIAQEKARPEMATRTEEELHEAERARVIWATYQMCSEGVDIPAVDTLGLATPVSDVEQAYGRARRFCVPKAHGGEMSPDECQHYCSWRAGKCRGKPKGVAFDIVDVNIPLGRRRKKYRLKFYESIGTKVAGAGQH